MNFKVRLRNKTFWVACIALIILILQYIQSMVGMDLNITVIDKMLNALLLCAVTLGVMVDPTTPSIKDAAQVMENKAKERV